MNSTFLVTLSTPSTDQSTLLGLAEQVQESLEEDGLDVQSVVPWAHPSQGEASILSAKPETPLKGLF